MRDSARVFISPDGALLAASWRRTIRYCPRTPRLAELPRFISASSSASYHSRQRVQELFDSTGGWRQVRVDLSEFAGATTSRSRFDFSTAGDMNQNLGGDRFGNFESPQRGQEQRVRGLLHRRRHDRLLGTRRDGYKNFRRPAQNSFFATPPNPDPYAPSEVLVGPYQLEIRRGTEYGVNVSTVNALITVDNQYHTNKRMIPDFARLGDQNLHREQGHIQIESNTIWNVSEYGIRYDAAARDAVGSVPHPGSVLNAPTLNNKQLAPGATIVNNVIANFGLGGILVSGDPNLASTPLASTPFARIVNNTIYGGATATGDRHPGHRERQPDDPQQHRGQHRDGHLGGRQLQLDGGGRQPVPGQHQQRPDRQRRDHPRAPAIRCSSAKPWAISTWTTGARPSTAA